MELGKQLLKGVEGAASSVDGQIVVADGTTGKKIAFTNKQTLSATSPITVSNTPTVIAGAAPVMDRIMEEDIEFLKVLKTLINSGYLD